MIAENISIICFEKKKKDGMLVFLINNNAIDVIAKSFTFVVFHIYVVKNESGELSSFSFFSPLEYFDEIRICSLYKMILS